MKTSEAAELTIPVVHLNGTSKVVLLKQLSTQATAVRAALDALCQNRPHGRDYYVLPPGAYEKARDQHEARIDSVRRIYDELVTIAERIQEDQ